MAEKIKKITKSFKSVGVENILTRWRMQKSSRILISLLRYMLLFSLSYIILYPLLYMLSNSFKSLDQAIDPSVVWVPKSITLENFATAAEGMKYWSGLWVTLGVNIVSALIEVGVCCIIGYGFARFNFREKKLLFALVMLTVIIPPQAIIAPLYLNFRYMDFFGLLKIIGNIIGKDIRLDWINTPLTFYIPSIFGVGLRSGLFIFIYRQFFKGMPVELEEAAYVDGAGPFRTFLRIMIPSAGPALLTVLIFSVVWHWNDYYLSAMLFDKNYPLAVNLSFIRSGLTFDAGTNATLIRPILMAGCFLFILPILIMYIFLQRYFLRSIERVGIVG